MAGERAGEGRPAEFRRVRVLHVIDGLGVGGAQSVLRALVALVDADRFESIVVNVGGGYDRGLASELGRHAEILDLRARGLWDVGAAAALVRLVRARDVDVIHTHLSGADVLGGLAGLLMRRPVLATLHSVAAWRLSYSRPRRILADLALRRLVDAMLAVSEAVRETHVAEIGLAAERLRVLENIPTAPIFLPAGFDPSARRAEFGLGRGPLICSASRLTPERDHVTLVRALPSVLARHPNSTTVLLGDGPERERVAAEASRLALGNAVRFLGTRLDAPEIVACCDIFCQPTWLEGLPIAVLDAMSLGKPVVASRVPGVASTLHEGETGLLVRPGDPDALGTALLRLLDDPLEAEALGRRAKAAVEARHDAGRWITTIEALYADLARSRSSARRTRSHAPD